MNIKDLWEMFKQFAEGQLTERKIATVESWDGSAGQYATAEEYCSACLIDLNGDGEKTKSRCYLPVKAPGSNDYADKGIMAAAGGRGISAIKKPADVSQEDFDAAIKQAATKLESLYKEMDKEAPLSVMAAKERAMTFSQIEGKAWEEMSEMPMMNYSGAYVDNDGRMYCLGAYDGKLYRCELSLMNGEIEMGNPQEVTQEFVPKTRTQIIRENGKVRWLSISATATLNRSGEIDSRQLFDNFIKRAEATGEYPQRIFYHTNGKKFVTGQADFLARAGNCYITGGVYNDSFLAQAEIKARETEPDYWGDSIGYLPLGEADFIKVRGFDIPVYTDGINVEISTLPANQAASLFIKTEVKRMNDKQLEALARLSFDGDMEAAKKWIEENPDEVNRQIEEKGLVTRNAESETVEFDLTDEVIGVIVERMAENQVIRSLQDKLTEQAGVIEALSGQVLELRQALAKTDQRLNEVQKTDAEKVRNAVKELPSSGVVKLGYRPSIERVKENDQRTAAEIAEATLDSIGLKY